MNGLIVGMGSIGKRHFTNLQALGQSIKGIDIQDSLEEALDAKPDFVYVCTPTRAHIPVALRVAERRIPYFIEKPLSCDMEEVEQLCQVSEGLTTMVGCNLRFHPTYELLHNMVEPDKRYLVQAVFGYNLKKWSGINAVGLGEDIALEAIHEIDYCDWILKGLRDLTGFTDRQRAVFAGRAWDGSFTSISLDSLVPQYIRTCRLATEGLDVVADLHTDSVIVRTEKGITKYSCPSEDMYVKEAMHFLEALGGRATVLNPIREAARVLALVLKVQDNSNYSGPKIINPIAKQDLL